jgi:hypothetical protein
MLEKKFFAAFLSFVFVIGSAGLCAELEDDWNDFLHYTKIGRFDLAKGYGQNIIDSNPDPKEVFALSQSNVNGYRLLLKMHDSSEDLREVSGKILDIINQGRYELRTDPKVITEEIRRLSGTIRGRLAAEERLKSAGEYAIPYMLGALADEGRREEFPNITGALGKMGRDAIRPLVCALQTENVAVKGEIIRALGEIGYPQSLGYLKCVAEKDSSEHLKSLAEQAIEKIDPSANKLPAAELLFRLGEQYYNHTESLAPAEEYNFANVWFWDSEAKGLVREEVDKSYFNELMAMRSCEWALKADENIGKAIALWLAAFFKAESTGQSQPDYFGPAHMSAMDYATTAGPEYLHQALERAIEDNNAYVALGVVEALVVNAGEKSLLQRVGTEQPLVKALSFGDRNVRYSAAIALGHAGPSSEFIGSELIIENLSAALMKEGADEIGEELADSYSLRAIEVMLQLAIRRNEVVDLSRGLEAVIAATKDSRGEMQILAGEVLARLESPDAQRAIAAMALLESNSQEIRILAFESLMISAKQNANLLNEDQIDAIYSLVSSDGTEPAIRSVAAGAYGALNLPSRRVKDLILDQSKS